MTHTEMTTADVRRAVVQHAARVGYPPLPASEVEARFDQWLEITLGNSYNAGVRAEHEERRPREMTAEELDALPAGTIVMDRGGEPWLCCSYDGSCWEGLEAVMTPRALIRLSPLRVLYVPEEATR